MRSQPEEWAVKWLKKQHEGGSRGLTLEKVGNRHYVYWATTKWDKNSKKRKKVSEYIGILVFPGELVISSDIDVEKMDKRAIAAANIDIEKYRKKPLAITNCRVRGTMAVLERACKDFSPSLKECFPESSDDLLMLAMARLCGRGRLSQAGKWFTAQDNLLKLNTHLDTESLSSVLKDAGGCMYAQDRFFESLRTPGKHVAVDMTLCFIKGRAFIIKKGYNRFHLNGGQFNMALICGLDDKLPQALKTVAENVNDGRITDILKKMGIGIDQILVLDRSYFSKELVDELHSAGYLFVISVRRNSPLYKEVNLGPGMGFRFRDDAVLCGRGKWAGYNAFRFENETQRSNELYGMMWGEKSDSGDNRTIEGDPSRAGNLILITNLDEDAKALYEMYMLRCSVEEHNNDLRTLLSMDSTYLRDNQSIMGFNLVSFIALRMYMTMEQWIVQKKMTSRYSPSDLLYEYGSLLSIKATNQAVEQTIPTNILQIEEDLALGIVKSNVGSEKEDH